MELIDVSHRFGCWTFAGDDPHTGETVIVEKFDKAHALAGRDRAQLRKAENIGRGENLRLAFTLTPYIREQIRQETGIDARNPDQWPALFAKIRSDYPHIIENT